MGIFRRLFGGDPKARFWSWFAAHAAHMTFPPSEAQRDELARRLRKVHGGLAFQIGQFDGVNVLEVSADGDPNLVPVVQDVCAAAPAVSGWRVCAFRQRNTEAAGIMVNGVDLQVSNIWFIIEGETAPVDLVIFIDDLDEHPELAQAAALLLDATVGELTMLTKVDRVAIADGSERPDHADRLTTLHDTLAGIEPPSEDRWAIAQVTLENGTPLTVTFRTGATAKSDRSQLATRITISWRYPDSSGTGMPSREHLHAMRELEQNAASTEAVLLMSKTGDCARESIFQVRDGTAFLAGFRELASDLDVTYGTQVAPDPTWSLWRTTISRIQQMESTTSS